ncbi:LacI family DNA-binding transcriptional regulator [Curtobacterium ammoniigenes]|uniref:LacI family DNA-binding transcriptional regulator n=1 Tax=Curtobacterium ammoniigenes TaxID=395387 RepID=UPI000830600E|nr:LacI family DNA-binding transcriptional regulator [Curtobacterium ammoniigenes]
MSGPARLRDVAERAGVSIRTVSNVVNGYARVSESKRQRVEEAVAALGYRPNLVARNLKSGRSGLIALIVPELDVPYFAELARAVVTTARAYGYTVVVDQTDGEPDRERELIQREGTAALFDGIILSPLALSAADLPPHDPAQPLVLLGERVAGSEYDHVAIDNVAAARAATSHLFDLGRRRIAAIGDQPYETGETAQLRTTGYRLAHEDRGIPVDESLIIPRARFHFGDGADAMRDLLQHPNGAPDAVFCFNDLVAIGAMRVALEAGLRIPEDLAVVGFDDIEASRYQTPSLTTIAPNRVAIAQTAVERVMARFGDHADQPPEEFFVGYELVVRESTAGATR